MAPSCRALLPPPPELHAAARPSNSGHPRVDYPHEQPPAPIIHISEVAPWLDRHAATTVEAMAGPNRRRSRRASQRNGAARTVEDHDEGGAGDGRTLERGSVSVAHRLPRVDGRGRGHGIVPRRALRRRRARRKPPAPPMPRQLHPYWAVRTTWAGRIQYAGVTLPTGMRSLTAKILVPSARAPKSMQAYVAVEAALAAVTSSLAGAALITLTPTPSASVTGKLGGRRRGLTAIAEAYDWLFPPHTVHTPLTLPPPRLFMKTRLSDEQRFQYENAREASAVGCVDRDVVQLDGTREHPWSSPRRREPRVQRRACLP